MRNKLFSAFFCLIFLFMFIGAPTVKLLTDKGILEYKNVGNEIVSDKTYEEDVFLGGLLTKIEDAKVSVKDTYINSLPFFLDITNYFKPLKSDINRPMLDWLQQKGVENTVFECRHVYDSWTAEPTCTDEGYTLKTCRLCKQTLKEDVVSALGHSFEPTQKTEPLCESDGYTLYTCTMCSAIEQRDKKTSLGHAYVLQSEEPATCLQEGSQHYLCTRCSSYYTTLVKKLPHVYEGGVCTICGADESFVARHEHVYEKNAVEPTCTQEGYDVYTCTECGDSYRDNLSLPTGHKYVSEVVAPTCTEEGCTLRVCEMCGDSHKTDRVEPKGHSFVITTVAPTYSEEGYDLHACSSCSHSYRDNTVPMLENDIPLPETTDDPDGTTYASSLRTTDSIFRHYSITARFPDARTLTTYARIVLLDREELYNSMIYVSELVNAMVEKDRDVNWYFYFATNIEATEFGTTLLPQETTRYIYEEFLTRVDSSVKIDSLEVNSFTDYYEKFYITDHHWNHHGSEEAYNGIVRMLRENYADISPVPLLSVCEFDDVKFSGSLSRAHAEFEITDTFGYYYHDLPEHTVEIERSVSYGSRVDIMSNLKKYLKSEFNKSQGYNHYTEFYRVCKKITYPDNNTGRNLLLIGDSYSLPLLELVAAHFDNTYIRYEDRTWKTLPEELIYETFIEENNITDVIVIEEMAKSIMQGYGAAYPSGFLNIFPDEEW